MCLCPALRSRSGPQARGPRPTKKATYCVHGGVGPPGVSRQSQTMYPLSRLNHAALARAPYASRIPCGYAVPCSLPSGCQPFSGGCDLPTGHRLHVSSSFRWFPHVLVAGARPRGPGPKFSAYDRVTLGFQYSSFDGQYIGYSRIFVGLRGS